MARTSGAPRKENEQHGSAKAKRNICRVCVLLVRLILDPAHSQQLLRHRIQYPPQPTVLLSSRRMAPDHRAGLGIDQGSPVRRGQGQRRYTDYRFAPSGMCPDTSPAEKHICADNHKPQPPCHGKEWHASVAQHKHRSRACSGHAQLRDGKMVFSLPWPVLFASNFSRNNIHIVSGLLCCP